MKPTDSGQGLHDLRVDLDNLYREEQFTDLKVATLRRLSPVKRDGSPDPGRPPIFVGQTHVMTRAGPLPVEFEVPAGTLEEAAQRFPQEVQRAVDEMIAQAQQIQREQASSIILPAGPLPAGMGNPGGKIKLP